MLNIDSFFEALENELLSVIKTELTNNEKEELNNLKDFVLNNNAFDNEKFKIYVNKQEFTINIKLLPKNWFYGEIDELKDCKNQSRNLNDLITSIKQYLEIYLETNEILFFPTDEVLKEIRDNNNSNSKLFIQEKLEWINAPMEDSFNKWEFPPYHGEKKIVLP